MGRLKNTLVEVLNGDLVKNATIKKKTNNKADIFKAEQVLDVLKNFGNDNLTFEQAVKMTNEHIEDLKMNGKYNDLVKNATIKKKAEQEINVGNTIEYNNELFGENILKFKVEKIKKMSDEFNSKEIEVFKKFLGEKEDYNKDEIIYFGTLTDENEKYKDKKYEKYEKSFEYVILKDQLKYLFDMKVY